MQQPVPAHTSFGDLMHDVERGQIKIPQFQRDFVWSKEKSARLLDSILKGYPVGTFILWRTQEQLRNVRNIGNIELPAPEKGDYVSQVLDGQQRITSLFAAYKGITLRTNDRNDDFKDIYVILDRNEDDEQLVVTEAPEGYEDGVDCIGIHSLLHKGFRYLNAFPEKHHTRLESYQGRLRAYDFSIVTVRDASIDTATEIFTRINVTGQKLSVFEIMVAKTFDYEKEFDLAQEYDDLIDRLGTVDYDTVPASVVLQVVASILVNECQKKHILQLDKKRFIDIWPEATGAIIDAVEYFRNTYRIPVSALLPYYALLVPFAYFFYHKQDRPDDDQAELLRDFFWRTVLTARYSYSLEAKIAQDLKRIDQILNGSDPRYDQGVDASAAFVRQNGWFSATRSFVKGILCILAYHEPKSLRDNATVRIANDWLKRANSKNYHHVFPRAFLRKQGVEEDLANHVGNIAIVDDHLNKRSIGSRAPSSYVAEFQTVNPRLGEALRSHLIDLEVSGLLEDDYDRFLAHRCEKIADALRERIIDRKVDQGAHPTHLDDYDVQLDEAGG